MAFRSRDAPRRHRHFAWCRTISIACRRSTTSASPASTVQSRPIVGQVADNFLACGVLEHGTACPTSHGVMRIVAFLTQASVIDQILAHVRARPAPAAHAGASDWSRRDRPRYQCPQVARELGVFANYCGRKG